jgi:adenylate cyclase, class 2
MKETEVKILNVEVGGISLKMDKLGAQKVLDTKLTVDWYGPSELYGDGKITEGQDPWFLRIRTSTAGETEITWKGKSEVLGASRSHEEINFTVSDPQKAGAFLEVLGFVHYAHQEKMRTSWKYQDWRFDLDQYPDMPAYLEIEGSDESHIQEAISLLSLENNKTSSEGERVLIQKEYNLDWYNMKFL